MVKSAIQLTPHQSQLLTEGVDYLSSKEHQVLLVEGAAGTGKTTLIGFMVKALLEKLKQTTRHKYTAVMTAPTNKAVEVLRNKSNLVSKEYSDYATLHSALCLKYQVDEKTGQEFFAPDKESKKERIRGAVLLIVDEASMIGASLLKYVEDLIETERLLKVIFVGDIKQLPPVNELSSPVFAKGYKALSLKEIIRQAAENPIIALSDNIPLLNSFQNQTNSDGLGYTFTKDLQKIIRHFARNREDLGIRYLGYTNRCVNSFNNLVRKEIFHQPKKVELGETIILDRPYEAIYFDEVGNMHRHLYCNNEEVLIEEVEVRNEKIELLWNKKGGTNKVRLKYYRVNNSIQILHEESEFVFADFMETLRQKVINRDFYWRDFYTVRNTFVAFKHRYALTVHKAQGSTYREVFLDYDDMMHNRNLDELSKLLYTAITRASQHLTVITSRLQDGR